jgi:4'-phosphopantetheinyl transferase
MRQPVVRSGKQWCRVWVANVAWRRPAHDALLDSVERARANAYVREADCTRFVVGVAMLKLAVAHEEGVAPSAVRVDRRCATCGTGHGAPRIVGSDLHVSVSHSGARVVVAITPAGPVGVDVEEREARVALPCTQDVLTPAEPLRNIDDLLTYWCRKESALKASGAGLAVSPLDVVVSPANEPARLVSYKGAAVPARIADLELGFGYAAAITVLTSEVVSYDLVSGQALLRDGRLGE